MLDALTGTIHSRHFRPRPVARVGQSRGTGLTRAARFAGTAGLLPS